MLSSGHMRTGPAGSTESRARSSLRAYVRPHHLERIALNSAGEELRREWLLGDLKQRIRDVRQGPDGLLYVLTDEDEGALLRIEPGL